MKIVALPHMGQRVEGEGDIAGPGMGDLDPPQLREAIGHVAVEDRRADGRIDLGEPRTAAENHARTVRRQPVIAKHPAGV